MLFKWIRAIDIGRAMLFKWIKAIAFVLCANEAAVNEIQKKWGPEATLV
jgi:hypothetical protein